jgi:hypothetical protein
MREIRLTEKEIIYNSGDELWNYMFYEIKLPYRQYEEDEDADLDDWYEVGLEWLSDELLDGEIFEVLEDNPTYAFTSMGRHANLRKKSFKALTLQGNSIAGNMTGGAFSMSKLVKNKWNIDLDYTTLPYDVTKHIKTTNAAKHIKEWIDENG